MGGRQTFCEHPRWAGTCQPDWSGRLTSHRLPPLNSALWDRWCSPSWDSAKGRWGKPVSDRALSDPLPITSLYFYLFWKYVFARNAKTDQRWWLLSPRFWKYYLLGCFVASIVTAEKYIVNESVILHKWPMFSLVDFKIDFQPQSQRGECDSTWSSNTDKMNLQQLRSKQW